MSALFGAQTVVTGGNFLQQNLIQQHGAVSKDPFDRLLEAASPTALHNSYDVYDPPKCHPNTRVAVLNKIMDWIRGLDPETRNALIMWLYGPAGSGKSAIARSTAERCHEEGILVASYFFSRSDSTRNHGRSLIATIAYQASICFPDIRDQIVKTIGRDPLIFTRSLDAQILALVVEPIRNHIDTGYFNTIDSARLVIIDGLDECDGRESQVKILTTISRALQQHRLPFIWLIASRPEHDIRSTFDVGYLRENLTRIALNDDYLPSKDIRLFLKDKFADIQQTHPFRAHLPPIWPSAEILKTLVYKSSGQFIYASTVIKFVQSSRHRPHQRLDIVLGIRPVHREMPFAELDALYRHILSSADDPGLLTRILAFQRFSGGPIITVDNMEELLSLNAGDLSEMLCDLTSLITVDEDIYGEDEGESVRELQVLHESLWDFLLDQSRSDNFYINDPVLHAELAHLYLRYFQDYPKRHDYDISDFLSLFRRAVPTKELRDDMMNISFVVFLVEARVLIDITDFLATINSWNFDGPDLHRHQVQLFDQFAQGIMEKMYSDPSLTALVAVTSMKVSWSSFATGCHHLFQLKKGHWALDKLSFSCEVHMRPDEYGRFISEFLEDRNRSGIYALNGERYAAAAMYFLKHIQNHKEEITPSSRQIFRKYKRQEGLPWLCRRTVKHAQSSEAAQIKSRFQLDRKKWFGLGLFRADVAFYLALKCLAHVLPRSDCSEELTVLARQLRFGPLSRKNTRQKSAVRREIARYLARVE